MSRWYHYSLVSKVCQIHFLWIHLFYTALIYQIGVKYCVQMIYHTCVKSMLNYCDGCSRSTNILYIKFVSNVTPLFPCVKSMSNPYPIYACSSCFDISNLCQTCLPNAMLCQKYVKSSPRKIVTRYIKFVSNVESWLTLFLCVKSMSIFFAKIITLRLCQKYVKSIPWKTFILHCFDISNLCQIWCQDHFLCVKSMSNPFDGYFLFDTFLIYQICFKFWYHSSHVSKACQIHGKRHESMFDIILIHNVMTNKIRCCWCTDQYRLH